MSHMVAESVYVLCALTSTACAALQLRAYRRSRVGFLFWTTLCFAGFALNNWVLFADLVIFPDADFSLYRALPALAGLGALTYGLIWEVR